MPGERRTRKEKEQARHNFTLSWQPGKASQPTPGGHVKGHFAEGKMGESGQIEYKKSAEAMAQSQEIESAKRDIIKSIIFVSLILATELVIYLAASS